MNSSFDNGDVKLNVSDFVQLVSASFLMLCIFSQQRFACLLYVSSPTLRNFGIKSRTIYFATCSCGKYLPKEGCKSEYNCKQL